MSSVREADVEMNNTANNKVVNNDTAVELQTYDPAMDNNVKGIMCPSGYVIQWLHRSVCVCV